MLWLELFEVLWTPCLATCDATQTGTLPWGLLAKGNEIVLTRLLYRCVSEIFVYTCVKACINMRSCAPDLTKASRKQADTT